MLSANSVAGTVMAAVPESGGRLRSVIDPNGGRLWNGRRPPEIRAVVKQLRDRLFYGSGGGRTEHHRNEVSNSICNYVPFVRRVAAITTKRFVDTHRAEGTSVITRPAG